jgi:ATP-binding cassette, subfamily B (MDR/TAP), member 1
MAGDELNGTNHSTASAGFKKKKKKPPLMASIGETLSFVWECGPRIQMLFVLGVVGGLANGLVYPALAYIFSSSFSSISASSTEGLKQVRELAYTFLVVGVYALVAATVQSWCLQIVAYHTSHRFRLAWFKALLRLDPAYFDVNNVAGIAQQVGPNANKYQRGIDRKLGEGVQYLTTAVGGLAFAFYSSWRVAFVVLSIIPFISFAAVMIVSINQTKGTRAAIGYKEAGGVAYSSVSAIRTVLSLNAIPEMVCQYKDATHEAYKQAVAVLFKQGFFTGAMMGSFLVLYCVLTIYGTSLLYKVRLAGLSYLKWHLTHWKIGGLTFAFAALSKDIEDTGCDPSEGVKGTTGPGVFGSMLGVAFAAQGVSQFGNFSEDFTAARVAVYEAFKAINRKPGSSEEIIYKNEEEDDLGSTSRSKKSKQNEGEPNRVVKAVLPKYEIDSTSTTGLKPVIKGDISVADLHFTYPTRPNDTVLNGLNVEIVAGQTVAFVGRSGSGKSTIMSLLERFYDPQSGRIAIDGVNIKDFNVSHLRSSIGYVGQEPSLFATTIRGNIRYGKPGATDEEVEAAARLANAHDFIVSFSDGYDTQVGDKGSQLSGGQKQRIAIARVLFFC